MNVPHNERVYEALGFCISLALIPNSLTQFNSVQLMSWRTAVLQMHSQFGVPIGRTLDYHLARNV